MGFKVSESWGYHFGGPQKKDAYVGVCFGVPHLWQLPLKVFGLGSVGFKDWGSGFKN